MRLFLIRIIAILVSASTCFTGLFGLGGIDVFKRYDLPAFTNGIRRGTYESSGETVIARYAWTAESDYDAYLAALREAGFAVYDENKIDENRFATLYKDETAVFVSWFK